MIKTDIDSHGGISYEAFHGLNQAVCGENGFCGECDRCVERNDADDVIRHVLSETDELYAQLDKLRLSKLSDREQGHCIGNAQQLLIGLKARLGDIDKYGVANDS